MLNFLTNSSHPELAYEVHQCASFCNNPKRIHEQAIKRIIQYLLSKKTKNGSCQGLLFKIDKTKSIDIYVDASFAGDWDKSWSEEPSSVFSRTRFVIYYAGCLVIWMSKLQSKLACPLQNQNILHYPIQWGRLFQWWPCWKRWKQLSPIEAKLPRVHCTIFEDNNWCIELVKCPKMRPRTKLIGLKFHRFRSSYS